MNVVVATSFVSRQRCDSTNFSLFLVVGNHHITTPALCSTDLSFPKDHRCPLSESYNQSIALPWQFSRFVKPFGHRWCAQELFWPFSLIHYNNNNILVDVQPLSQIQGGPWSQKRLRLCLLFNQHLFPCRQHNPLTTQKRTIYLPYHSSIPKPDKRIPWYPSHPAAFPCTRVDRPSTIMRTWETFGPF